jgi:protein SCO1/2
MSVGVSETERPTAVRRALPWVALSLLVIVGGLLALWPSAGKIMPRITEWLRGSEVGETLLEKLDQYGQVPDFSLVERSGRPVTIRDLQGRVWVANFIYTQCTETCPTQSLQVSRLQAEFAAEPDLRLVSITVDPERDTPEVLARYAERYQANPERWLFLTGSKRAVYRLAADGFRLSVVDPDDPRPMSGILRLVTPHQALATHGAKGLIIHSSRLVLVDRQAEIRAYHRPDDEQSRARLRQNLRTVLREKPKER